MLLETEIIATAACISGYQIIYIYNINNRIFKIYFDYNKKDKTYVFYHVKIENKNGIHIYIYSIYKEITE